MKNNIFKQKRLLKGLSVTQVSEKLYLSKSYLWNIENGRRLPGRDTAIKMSILYECSIDDFFPSKTILTA